MSFNVGKKKSIKRELTEMGYAYITPSDFSKKCDKIMVEAIRVTDSFDDNTGEISRYGAIAGSALKDDKFVGKRWFYIPSVDNANLIHANDDDLRLIESGNYIYTIEILTSQKGRDYCAGTLLED